jgi:hypothetical protein
VLRFSASSRHDFFFLFCSNWNIVERLNGIKSKQNHIVKGLRETSFQFINVFLTGGGQDSSVGKRLATG